MPVQEYSPRRSRTSRKPWPECPEIRIYSCANCRALFQSLNDVKPGTEETPASEASRPIEGAASPEKIAPTCCGQAMKLLEPFMQGEQDGAAASYRIVGGLNNSAVEVFWEGENRPEWIMLKTFTGSYIRYLTEKKKAPMVFPLADEDAYVYCDRPVCEQCVFRCKRGFVIYIYYGDIGLLELPMDEMSGYFSTKA